MNTKKPTRVKIFKGLIPFSVHTGFVRMFSTQPFGVAPGKDTAVINWKKNEVFEANLIWDRFECGRSSPEVWFTDTKTNIAYPMFFTEFTKIMPLICRSQVRGEFYVRKQGDSYSLVYAKPGVDYV